jgi:hypothetical protein
MDRLLISFDATFAGMRLSLPLQQRNHCLMTMTI